MSVASPEPKYDRLSIDSTNSLSKIYTPTPIKNRSTFSSWSHYLSSFSPIPWMFAVFTLPCIVAVLWVSTLSRRNCDGVGKYSSGHTTDFAPARQAIALQEITFSGTLLIHENGTTELSQSPDGHVYAGPPSDEIDKNWEELIRGRYFYITEEEAREAWSDKYKEYHYEAKGKDGYAAGLDVLHTLHCVDKLRRNIDEEYYSSPKFTQSHFGRDHYYHCVDLLRQYIMCAGDLTPIPSRWSSSIQGNYIDSDQQHVCRDFGKIREWVDSREAL